MWALGLILFQLVSPDEYPFDNLQGDYLLKNSIVNDQPKALPDTVPELIKEIITILLEKNPEKRPDAKTLINRDEIKTYIKKVID